jgi:hypothetical protein
VATLRAKVRKIVRGALQAGERLAARRTSEARRVQTFGDATALAYARHLDAELTLAAPIMRQAYSEDWWTRATPQQIGAVWEATASWAAVGEGYAQATLQHLREQTSQRYGVDVRDLRMQARDVVALLSRARGAQDTPAPAPGSRTVSYVIRDTTGTVLAQHLGIQPPPGMTISEHAARQLIQFSGRLEEQAGEPVGGLTGRFVIEAYAGDDVTIDPALTLTGDRVAATVQSAEQSREQILSGVAATSPEELLDALLAEEHRLAEELTGHVDAMDFATAEAIVAHANQAAIVRERLDYVRLRIQAADADVRGENGTHVFQQASLRARYDDAWWTEATPQEASVLWRYAAGWSEGSAKLWMTAYLQDRIYERFGVIVDTDADAQQVPATLTAAAAARDQAGATTARRGESAAPGTRTSESARQSTSAGSQPELSLEAPGPTEVPPPAGQAPPEPTEVPALTDGRTAASTGPAAPDAAPAHDPEQEDTAAAQPALPAEPEPASPAPALIEPAAAQSSQTPATIADPRPAAARDGLIEGRADQVIQQGYVVIEVSDPTGTTLAVRQYVEGVINDDEADPDQLFFIDGSDRRVWGMPSSSTAKVVHVPENERHRLPSVAISYTGTSPSSPTPVESEIPEHLWDLMEGLVSRGVVVRVEPRTCRRSRNSPTEGHPWSRSSPPL